MYKRQADADYDYDRDNDLTEGEAEDLLHDVLDDIGDWWNPDKKYDFDTFDEDNVNGDEAFAYYVSDKIFGNADVTEIDDEYDLKIGDVIRFNGRYCVVYDTWNGGCEYVTIADDGDIDYDEIDFDDDYISRMYTRY